MVLLSAHFHRVLRTALENSVVAKIPTCLLQWMEILNVVNLEEKSSKINSIPRLETAFLDCSINVLLWKKKTFPLHTSFLKIHHSLFLQGSLEKYVLRAPPCTSLQLGGRKHWVGTTAYSEDSLENAKPASASLSPFIWKISSSF